LLWGFFYAIIPWIARTTPEFLNSIAPNYTGFERLKGYWIASEKQPLDELEPPVAAITPMAFLYTSFILCDSVRQSSVSSWMMHKESIQRYLISNHFTAKIASWNVFGSLLNSMVLLNSLRFPNCKVSMGEFPQ
jgi:hypothetical protein